jgi:hypothetical protein
MSNPSKRFLGPPTLRFVTAIPHENIPTYPFFYISLEEIRS